MRTHSLLITASWLLGVPGVAHAAYNEGATVPGYVEAPTRHAALSDCNDCTATIALPWTFQYFGRQYTQLTVSSNGFVVLGSYTGGALPSNVTFDWSGKLSIPGPVIAPLWDDWDPAAGGDIYTGLVGGIFVVEWFNVRHRGQTSGSNYSFELKLTSSGNIVFDYGNMTGGGASWDRGVSATVGIQEDVDTVGKPISSNTASINTNSAKMLTRPGKAALYVNAKDGFYAPPRVRANLKFRQAIACGQTWHNIDLTTSAEWNWSGSDGCGIPTLAGNANFIDAGFDAGPDDTQGYDVATIPGMAQSVITHGTYRFVRRSDFTPSPSAGPRWQVSYNGESATYTSKLDYWDSGSVDKPILIVSGFDPLNESSTAEYLVLMGDLARAALAEGRDIAIGKFGDGNRRISWFHDEVGRWVEHVYPRAGNRKVQVAGVSMGGVVTRGAIDWNSRSIRSKVSAWYSVDGPQTGANLGGFRGAQTLLRCYKAASDPNRRAMTSNAAADMGFVRADTCTCPTEPENSLCNVTSTFHDEYYGSIGWPTQVPRYTAVFGDGNVAGGYAKNGSGNLYDFEYTSVICSEDRDWPGTSRDCNAGSRYFTPAMINLDEDAGPCGGTMQLRLKYEPAFITVDSAFGATQSLVGTGDDPSCVASYPVLSTAYWNGWAANGHNENHKVMTIFLRDWMLTQIRSHAP